MEISLSLVLMEKPQKFRLDAANYTAYSLGCFVDQVRTMVISHERTTTSWSAGKIHSELGILSSSPSSNVVSNNGVAPMEIDRVEKGKQKGKSKGKSKDKNNF